MLYFTFVITERTIGFIDFIEEIESFFSIEIFFLPLPYPSERQDKYDRKIRFGKLR